MKYRRRKTPITKRSLFDTISIGPLILQLASSPTSINTSSLAPATATSARTAVTGTAYDGRNVTFIRNQRPISSDRLGDTEKGKRRQDKQRRERKGVKPFSQSCPLSRTHSPAPRYSFFVFGPACGWSVCARSVARHSPRSVSFSPGITRDCFVPSPSFHATRAYSLVWWLESVDRPPGLNMAASAM